MGAKQIQETELRGSISVCSDRSWVATGSKRKKLKALAKHSYLGSVVSLKFMLYGAGLQVYTLIQASV